MKPRSAKDKGRRFQNECREAFLTVAGDRLEADDIRSNPMGAPGEDLLFSPLARKLFPYSVECKCVERLNIWEAIEQAKSNARSHTPLVAFRKNNHEAWVALPMEKFLELFKNQ